ncbi:hypothetical protein KIN20_035063 [Parelaphostrongylus tenuis]|uniref:Uncharacterized protein n=1 Tax=Parelaphostrongylus tenuis TaxID=148309 RepID=A0AAD5RDJ2_PARTN|nr:hypothetical protein KIN20_035063 [Parelaphostrongylus tenuis]
MFAATITNSQLSSRPTKNLELQSSKLYWLVVSCTERFKALSNGESLWGASCIQRHQALFEILVILQLLVNLSIYMAAAYVLCAQKNKLLRLLAMLKGLCCIVGTTTITNNPPRKV